MNQTLTIPPAPASPPQPRYRVTLDDVASAQSNTLVWGVHDTEQDRRFTFSLPVVLGLDKRYQALVERTVNREREFALEELRRHLAQNLPADLYPDIRMGAELVEARVRAVEAVEAACEKGWTNRHGGHLSWIIGVAITVARRFKPGNRSDLDRDYQVAISELEKAQAWASEKRL